MAGQKLRGFVGQGMSARKTARVSLVRVIDVTSGSGSYTPTTNVTALIHAWGAGGSGAFNSTQVASGAGGGAAGYKSVRVAAGQTISYSVGAGGADQNTDVNDGFDGGDTTVTLPGFVLTAGGGKKGVQGASPKSGGLGGVCSGPWTTARSGGAGGDGVTGAGTAGGSPTGGGTGGAGSGNYGGGGAAAGFTDLYPGLPAPGNGHAANSSSDASTAPGGATGGANSNTGTFAGKDGRVVIYVMRVTGP